MDGWAIAYDLKEDTERIAAIQRATGKTSDFGVEAEVALFGTADWWEATKDGRIPVFDEQGVISRIFASGHGDWPEFEVSSPKGTSRWTRLGQQNHYVIGRKVRIQYVLQKSRMKRLGQPSIRIVLQIAMKTG